MLSLIYIRVSIKIPIRFLTVGCMCVDAARTKLK